MPETQRTRVDLPAPGPAPAPPFRAHPLPAPAHSGPAHGVPAVGAPVLARPNLAAPVPPWRTARTGSALLGWREDHARPPTKEQRRARTAAARTSAVGP